jgi:hypothetical protein
LKHRSKPRSKATIPALSWNTLTHHGFASSSVAALIVRASRLSIRSPRNSTIPPKVLCLQCSLQVCAMVSSSAIVGSRPTAT